MKKIVLGITIVMLIITQLTTLTALDTTPTGKNLFNPAKFYLDYDASQIMTVIGIEVLSNQTYTLSVPSQQILGQTRIFVYEDETTYIDEPTNIQNVCVPESYHHICTFTTGSETTHIDIVLTGLDVLTYIDYYGFLDFQLELGSSRTPYEPYVGEIQDADPPVFQGHGTLYTSYETLLTLDQIINNYITAYDEMDGDVTDRIIVKSDTYSGNETIVGTYTVLLEVSDYSLNTASFELIIVVKDEIAPVITGPNTFAVNVNTIIGIDTIITQHFTFKDGYDGVITSYTIVEDHYTLNTHLIGTYRVSFEVIDSSNNHASHHVDITVYDDEAPIITGPETLTLYLSDYPILEEILALYNVTDNYTAQTLLDIIIKTSNLPVNLDRIGTYSLILSATDESANEGLKEVLITIIDDIPPVISGINYYEIPYYNHLDLGVIIAGLIVSDNHDDLTHEDLEIIENTYQDFSDKLGTYRITFRVSDSNQSAFFNVYIRVFDDIAPTFNFHERILIESGSTLSSQDLSHLIQTNQQIQAFNPIAYEVLDEGYLNQNLQTGVYELRIKLTNVDNETIIHPFYIEVLPRIEPALSPQVIIKWISYGLLGFSMTIIGVLIIRRRF
jgi:acetyltransferase-like isoleucine patch superfamily enzyme